MFVNVANSTTVHFNLPFLGLGFWLRRLRLEIIILSNAKID